MTLSFLSASSLFLVRTPNRQRVGTAEVAPKFGSIRKDHDHNIFQLAAVLVILHRAHHPASNYGKRHKLAEPTVAVCNDVPHQAVKCPVSELFRAHDIRSHHCVLVIFCSLWVLFGISVQTGAESFRVQSLENIFWSWISRAGERIVPWSRTPIARGATSNTPSSELIVVSRLYHLRSLSCFPSCRAS